MSSAFAIRRTLETISIDDFSFVDTLGLGPEIDAPLVEKYFHPLHKEQMQYWDGEDDITLLETLLREYYSNQELQWRNDFKIAISEQHYGVGFEDIDKANKLLKYSKNVHDYLFERIIGLFHSRINWHVLHVDSSDISSAQGFNIIVGRYTYLVTRAFVANHNIPDTPYLANAAPLDRAINYIESGLTSAPKRGLIYLIPGATSLVSPFSELLHISLHQPSRRYEQELTKQYSREISHQKALQAGETVNEAVALLLAMEYQKKYGCDENMKTIDYMASSLAKKFPKLEKVISYTKIHGFQSTIDSYLENPGKLMALI